MKKSSHLKPRTLRGEVGAKKLLRWLVSALPVVLLLAAGTIVGTNLVIADPVPGASPVTVTFNYSGATGGTSVTSVTVTPGDSADEVLPQPAKSGLDFSGWFNTQSLLNGQRITVISEGDTGELLAGFVPPELAATLNLDRPIAPTCASGLGVCALGDVGPGGGLVFYDAGSVQPWGQYLEMAPKAWGAGAEVDPKYNWCNTLSYFVGANATGIGDGAANTSNMMTAGCVSSAANAATAYAGGGFTDWFLPSRDELNAMCNYSRTWVGSPLAPPTGTCTGSQDGMFAGSDFGFQGEQYWTSSQPDSVTNPRGWFANYQHLVDGAQNYDWKSWSWRIRPIRSF